MGKKSKPATAPRTTAINPAAVATILTAFSPSTAAAGPSYYAHLHAAPDAHTLRVYDLDGKCVSRWASNANSDAQDEADEPRVKSLAWCWVPPASAHDAQGDGGAAGDGKRGKKRRKSDGGAAADSPAKPSSSSSAALKPQLMLALGLESGAVLLWHPLGTASRTLSHPTSASPVTALAVPVSPSASADGHLWSAHQDGAVRVWDVVSGALVGKVGGLAEEPRWDDLLVRYEPASEEGGKRTVHLVLSHLSLHVYSVHLGAASKKEGKVRDLKATELGRCTGHVEPCSVRWTGASSSADSSSPDADKLSFLSYSPTDRFVQVWQIATSTPSSSPHIGLLLARLGTDSGVSSATVSPLAGDVQTLAAVDSATGNVTLSALPLSFAPAASPSKKAKKHAAGVVALEAQCEVTAPTQGGRSEAGVAEVAFRASDEAKAVLCRGGVKPVFEVVSFKEEGAWVSKVELARSAAGLLVANGATDSAGAPKPSRYSEHTSSTAAATAAPDAAAASDDEEAVNAGELDVDAAEPTLADRLKALNVSQKKERRKAARTARLDDDVEVASESSGSEDLDDDDVELGSDDEDAVGPAVPATTLTTTLVQALHSQDGPLLESCLAHSNYNLVRSTVKRLPSGGLVLSLLEAIVDRLGKQKKGREGLASPKRARALVGWLRETLVVHVGFLVTVPSLVSRLAALHASLTQRLALQQPLLALQGRLELVMSQIDLRQDRARAQTARSGGKAIKAAPKGTRYVEGESTDDEDEELGEGLEGEDSEGDVEDVVLGPGGDDDEDSGESDGFGEIDDDDVDSDFDDEEDGEGSKVPRHKRNGVASLLDLEAEDDDDFDEDDESLDGGEDLSDDPEAGEDEEFEA
ncbi:uncharacterized protein RHOBADRAFT_51975 [Rhodotorula graminis WP1]|uniref:Small-subunit processome Utp12 domain-containing protein n=1 Tax=Rhodotorula graminis (strain WP1) TaxID=578459 RepID=A0A194S8V7_RHOGW|nr:uncharacterized protein RHOBADRAFT_51975 [Rhodotorula graminis WP1]KPV77009.1 hypothetical protein RHOBADRAFT_51975 [Rhodotorula graminis WP1]